MKTIVSWFLALTIVFALVGFVLYKYYLPGMIAKAIVKEDMPAYVPEVIKSKMQKYKKPLNESAKDVITHIHESEVPLEKVLESIDKTDERHVLAVLDELSNKNIKTTNQVFDVIKKNIPTDFDIEVLRKPFNDNVTMAMVRSAVEEASNPRMQRAMEPEMMKAIAKNLLIQKENEFKRNLAEQPE